jgi:uncharacterized membrane protein YiaA
VSHDPHTPTRDEVARTIQGRPIPRGLRTLSLLFLVVGVLVFLVGVFTGQARAWQAFQFNWMFFTTISSAAVMLAAAQRITTARWSRPVIRIMEGFVLWLPVAWVLLLLTMLFGRGAIFPWTHEHIAVPEKAAWLSMPFFIGRVLVLFGIITALSVWFVYTSVRLDVGILPEWGAKWAKGWRDRMRANFRDERRELHSTHSVQGKLSVVLALAFGYFWTVLAWDLSMSVDLHFQSTMYGWQIFMGGWVVALMIMALLIRLWRNFMDAHELITEHHFHDVGKLCFAFTAFWGYLTFSQFLVIWYGNMAEETHFFHLRMIEPWLPLTLAVGILMFVIPFFGLLGKKPKVFTPTMTLFALSSIVGLWIHRYIEIYPSIYGVVTSLPFGLWEIGIFLGYLGGWGLCYIAFMDAFPRMRILLMTSPYRDEVQVPVDPETMEPLPAHE